MKSLWNSFKAAFAMFSKIPMPMVDWKKENIKYMMCFFPFVGTAIGILTWFAGGALGVHVALEPFFLAVILTVIPVFVTGGIHVDGLLDTSDALSSWQERTRRLEILKDSHAGAFAIITACVYFILWLGAWDQLLGNYNGICIMSLGFMMSRCLRCDHISQGKDRRDCGRIFQKCVRDRSAKCSYHDVCDPCSADDMGRSGPGCSGSCQRTSGILVVSPYGFEIFWRDHR